MTKFLFPGNRKWVAFDINCIEFEFNTLSENDQNLFDNRSDRIAHLFCAFGLPFISVTDKPFKLASNSAMAPFMNINNDTLSNLDRYQEICVDKKHGMSCGLHLYKSDALPIAESNLFHFLKKYKYSALVFGPESSSFFGDFCNELIKYTDHVFIIEDTIRHDQDFNRDSLSMIKYSVVEEALEKF